MSQIDYKELLIKYIGHIIYYEGIDYIDRFENARHTINLTDAEIAELEKQANAAREKFNP